MQSIIFSFIMLVRSKAFTSTGLPLNSSRCSLLRSYHIFLNAFSPIHQSIKDGITFSVLVYFLSPTMYSIDSVVPNLFFILILCTLFFIIFIPPVLYSARWECTLPFLTVNSVTCFSDVRCYTNSTISRGLTFVIIFVHINFHSCITFV